MRRETVFNTLEQSNAELLSRRTINHHLGIAHWRNSQDHITYNTDKVHTLSLYLQGGEGCKRLDVNRGSGTVGSLCLIPKSCDSTWQIDQGIRFAHLYFSDEAIKRFALTTLDIEPNAIQLTDLSFHIDGALAQLCEKLFHHRDATHSSSNTLAAEQHIQEIFKHLLTHQHYGQKHRSQPTGGLSPANSRLLTDYIRSNYARRISLSELAQLAGLSEFHLQRSFKQSHAISPHAYLQEVRLQQAKQRLKNSGVLAQIALDCGFAEQSYFNRVFKQHTGITPRQYQLACKH